jgi:DNA-binding response OmpR family regulator
MTVHILLIDDDALLRRSLAFNLEQAGYRVSTAANAEDALTLARRDPPGLVLLDIGLPGMDGLDALRHFSPKGTYPPGAFPDPGDRDGIRDGSGQGQPTHRSPSGTGPPWGIDVPVIFLTARRRELDQVLGLELGADDYVTKPFDLDVLLARIKAVLRRSAWRPQAERATVSHLEPTPLVVGDLAIDPAAHTLSVGGRSVELPPREFDLLHALALNAGRVVSTDELLASVWGAEYAGESQVVYVHIRWLREKLEEDPNHPKRIITMRGVGYKLEPQEVEA